MQEGDQQYDKILCPPTAAMPSLIIAICFPSWEKCLNLLEHYWSRPRIQPVEKDLFNLKTLSEVLQASLWILLLFCKIREGRVFDRINQVILS